jgi:D-arabinose 5-phosphate isomerase GutQ
MPNAWGIFSHNMTVYLGHGQLARKIFEKNLYEVIKPSIEDLWNFRKGNLVNGRQLRYITDGEGRSGLVADAAAWDLRFGGSVWASYNGWPKTPKWKGGDLLETISASGGGASFTRATKAREYGIDVKCITSNVESELAKISNKGVQYVPGRQSKISELPPEDRLTPMGNLSEWLSLMLLDLKLLTYHKWRGERSIESADEFLADTFRGYLNKTMDFFTEGVYEVLQQRDKIESMIDDTARVGLLLLVGYGPKSGNIAQMTEMRGGHAGYEDSPDNEIMFITSLNKNLIEGSIHSFDDEKTKNVRAIVISDSMKSDSAVLAKHFQEEHKIKTYVVTSCNNCETDLFEDRRIIIPVPERYSLDGGYKISPFHQIALPVLDTIACGWSEINNVVMKDRHKA